MLEEMRSLDIKELNKMIEKEDKEGRITEKCYWNDLWNCVVEEQANDYTYAEVKDALPLLVSEVNYRQRRYKANSNEMGVDIRKGDICYIDFGPAYINEIGFQHFGLILSIFHNKAFVIPMSGNYEAYQKAYSKTNPKGKRHLMKLGRIKGMNKTSVLFINDAKFINTARIIGVKAHLDIHSNLFKEIKERVIQSLE